MKFILFKHIVKSSRFSCSWVIVKGDIYFFGICAGEERKFGEGADVHFHFEEVGSIAG